MSHRVEFHSILYDRADYRSEADGAAEPEYFGDLNLDQVCAAVTGGRSEYDLAPFFYVPLRDVAEVEYRQAVVRDLEDGRIRAAVVRFASGMARMRERLGMVERLRNRYQKQRWFLDAAAAYRSAVRSLAADLAGLDPRSAGLRAFAGYVAGYTGSVAFAELDAQIEARHAELRSVAYTVHIRGSRVRVGRYDGEADYGAEVTRTFAKFAQEEARDYRKDFKEPADLNHVEEQVIALVAKLFPDVFAGLAELGERYRNFADPRITAFDREVQFYLGYLEFIRPLKKRGLEFCLPEVSADAGEVHAYGTFDLALARRLRRRVVTNDIRLTAPERILVVTGPNQGGKTTYARAFGQLHHLAALGLPVPGRAARLPLPDRVFTCFEREEDAEAPRGKLEDELVRVHAVLAAATGRSVLVLNETFTSTTLNDALYLGTEILTRITELGALCAYVTFVDELAALNAHTVSLVAAIDPDDPAARTYRIERRPADGLAYAAALAEKYGLTADALKRRLTP